jgi:hypothetical protein
LTAAGSANQSQCFHVNTARQTVLWFGALGMEQMLSAMNTVQSYSPIGNIIYGGVSEVGNTYQGGAFTKAVTVRGFTRTITFTNVDSNDLFFTFYECVPKEDTSKIHGPLELWQTGFSSATEKLLLYPASTVPIPEGDGVTAIDNTTNKSLHTICHSGETPHRNGLIHLHKKWNISTPKIIRVGNGESLRFTQNYKGGHVTYLDTVSESVYYRQGISKGTIVTVTGFQGIQASNVENPTGVVTTGSGQFVCRSETSTYYEAVLPSLPDSIMQTDNLYKGEPAGPSSIPTQIELGVDNTTFEVEQQNVHDG